MAIFVRVNRDGSLFWNGMKAKEQYIDKRRIGILLFQRQEEPDE